MLDWLKDVLGESYSEEIDKKISAEIGKAFVSKADFNAKNEEKKAIAEQLENANKQIEEFKGMDIDGIKKAADDWKLKAEQAQKDAIRPCTGWGAVRCKSKKRKSRESSFGYGRAENE